VSDLDRLLGEVCAIRGAVSQRSKRGAKD